MTEKKVETRHDIHHLLAERWSPRIFADKLLSENTIQQLFEAARWAASSNNGQPWRFMYTQKGDVGYQKMLDCLVEFNQSWVVNAPFLMLTAYKEKFDNGKENFHALHDLGLAMGNFSIQAQDLGIAVHQMAGVDWKKAHKVYDVPEGYHISTAVAAGYYGGKLSDLPKDLQEKEESARKRKALSEILSHGAWDFSR